MNKSGEVSLPLLASLVGVLAAAAMGIHLTRQLDRPTTALAKGAPAIEDAGIAPPPGGGHGRIIESVCGRTGRHFVLYTPHNYAPLPANPLKSLDRLRSYPLVVWLDDRPISADTINQFARRWGPNADQDRHFVLMPELSGNLSEDAAALPRLIEEFKNWWYVDQGPVILSPARKGNLELLAPILGTLENWTPLPMFMQIPPKPYDLGQDIPTFALPPADVKRILANEALWTFVQIEVQPRYRRAAPSKVVLVAVVADRVGKVANYAWGKNDELHLPPSRMRENEFTAEADGTYRVDVTVTNEAGRTFQAEGVATVPSPGYKD